MRDYRKVAAHRLEQRDAEAFVIGKRYERGRAAVVGHELLDGHASGERDRVVEPGARDLFAQSREVLTRHRGRADEVEARGRIGLAVLRERCDDVMDRLLRQDLPDREDRGALVLQTPCDLRIGRDVELLPVDGDRDDGGVGAAGLRELAAVVLAIGEPELGGARELGELLTAKLGVPARVLVQAFEVLGRRDVVVDDRLAQREPRDV